MVMMVLLMPSVTPLGHAVFAVGQDAIEMVLAGQGELFDRRQLRTSCPAESLLEKLAGRALVGAVPQVAEHLFDRPDPTGA